MGPDVMNLTEKQISKQLRKLKRKCCCGNSGSSNCCYEEITLTEALALVESASLVPNSLYKISGVHKNKLLPAFEILYDDGTNSGTTIYLKAIATNKFSPKGFGEFYNPIYDSTEYGELGPLGAVINEDLGRGTLFTTIVNFPADGGSGIGLTVNIVANVDGQVVSITIDDPGAGYVAGDVLTIENGGDPVTFWLTQGKNLYGIWDGDNPVIGNRNSFQVGDVAIWGGYYWQNTTGNLGTASDCLTLNPEDWTKLPYTYEGYNKVIDEIEYDIANDWISRRSSGTIAVFFPYSYWNSSENDWTAYSGNFNVEIHGISAMQWGNNFNEDTGFGVGLLQIDDSYAEFINFKGQLALGIELKNYSVINLPYFGYACSLRNLHLHNSSFFIKTEFYDGADLQSLSLDNESWFDSIVIKGNSSLYQISLTNGSYIQKGEGTIFLDEFSEIRNCSLNNKSYWTDINSTFSNFYSSSWDNECYMAGTWIGSSLSYSSFNNLTYCSCNLEYCNKIYIKADSSQITWVDLSHDEKNTIYTSTEIKYYVPITMVNSGVDLEFNIPAIYCPFYWYISEVTTSHGGVLNIATPSYITVGIDVEDLESGLDAVTGDATLLASTNVQRNILNNFVVAGGGERLIKINFIANGGVMFTPNMIHFEIIVKKTI